MPIVSCPDCRADLEVDTADLGHRVECPSCRTVFTAAAPPPPPPPAAPPGEEPGTRLVRCSECRGEVRVQAEDLGHMMQCPLCDLTFLASDRSGAGGRADAGGDREPDWRRSDRRPRFDDDEDDRPRRRRRPRYDDDDTPDGLIAHAQRECSAAGVGLIVIAVLGVAGGLLAVALMALMLGGAFPGGAGGPGGPDPMELWINVGSGILQLFVSAFLLYAGIQLRKAKNWGLCVTGCVIALLPFFSPCCLLGLVFGIIGLTKLNDPRVKRGFEANRAGFTGDGYN